MKILFVSATHIGDALLSTALLRHLLDAYPDARFTIACGPLAEGVFARMPRRDTTLVIRKLTYDRHWLKLWRRTVTTRWDLAIDLRGSALTWMIPARRRRVMSSDPDPVKHQLDRLARVLRLATPPAPCAWTAPEDRARAAALLGATPRGRLIGLGPTANWAGKVWPPDRFVALYRALEAGLPGARPVIFGGPGAVERATAAPVLAALPEAIDLVGATTIPEAMACLARCDLYVGNDSALMHLAAAAGAPTLGLFGPTDSRRYAPRGPRATFVAAPPGGPMTAVGVEQALDAARRLLRDTARDPEALETLP